jgi:hypothetical protein
MGRQFTEIPAKAQQAWTNWQDDTHWDFQLLVCEFGAMQDC